MKNLNSIFTHEDTQKIYKKEKIKFFKLFRAVMFFILFIGILYIGIAVYYLNTLNTIEEITQIQAPEITTALINGTETVICTYQDGIQTARVQYEKCEEVATITGMVNYCDREIIRIVLDK